MTSPNKPALKPIDTWWNGLYFRSRLEARWAVFYDKLGIKYEYEKEGYDLGDGIWYLPDFWLPEQKCFIEVKGNFEGPSEESRQIRKDTYIKCGRLAAQSGSLVFAAILPIGNVSGWYSGTDEGWPPLHLRFDGTRDSYWEDSDCPEFYNCSPFYAWSEYEKEKYRLDSPNVRNFTDSILIAYRTARAIRFEEVHRPEWQTIIDPSSGRTYATRIKTDDNGGGTEGGSRSIPVQVPGEPVE